MTTILTGTLDENGSTAWAEVIQGGDYVFSAYGTFDGSTVKLQYSVDNQVTAIDVSGDNASFTANGGGVVTLPRGHVRATMSSAGTSDVDVNVSKVF